MSAKDREIFYYILKSMSVLSVFFGFRGEDILERVSKKTDVLLQQHGIKLTDHLLRYSIFLEQLCRTVVIERSQTVSPKKAIGLFEAKLKKLENFYKGRLFENDNNDDMDEADLDFF